MVDWLQKSEDKWKNVQLLTFENFYFNTTIGPTNKKKYNKERRNELI